jgi:hypothetical protein
MAGSDSSRLAVLIDADNASAAVAKELLEEVAKFGTATVKRAYGDWTTTCGDPGVGRSNHAPLNESKCQSVSWLAVSTHATTPYSPSRSARSRGERLRPASDFEP